MAPQNFSDLINRFFLPLIQLIVPLIVSLAVLAFLIGLVKFLSRVGGDVKAVEEGKSLMIWGLLALFIMLSVYGLLRFFSGELGFRFGLPLLPQ